MLTVRIIPCLDVDRGRVVKGVRFQDLREAIARTPGPEGLRVTVSIGVSTAPGPAPAFGELWQAADAALYEAKHRGGDQVCFRGMDERAPEREPEADGMSFVCVADLPSWGPDASHPDPGGVGGARQLRMVLLRMSRRRVESVEEGL